MSRPLVGEFFIHSESSGVSECDVTFEWYRILQTVYKQKMVLAAYATEHGIPYKTG